MVTLGCCAAGKTPLVIVTPDTRPVPVRLNVCPLTVKVALAPPGAAGVKRIVNASESPDSTLAGIAGSPTSAKLPALTLMLLIVAGVAPVFLIKNCVVLLEPTATGGRGTVPPACTAVAEGLLWPKRKAKLGATPVPFKVTVCVTLPAVNVAAPCTGPKPAGANVIVTD